MHCCLILLLAISALALVRDWVRPASAAWSLEGVPVCVGCNARNPAIRPDGLGGAFIAWQDIRNASEDIYLQRLTAAGELATGWPAGGVPISIHPASQHYTALVPDGLGGVLIAWVDYRNTGPGGTSTDIYAQRVLADGSIAPGWPLNGAPVIRAPGIQTAPVAAPDGFGGAYISWHDDTAYDIFLQHLTASGEVAPGWPPNGLPVCTDPGGQGYPQLVPDGAGGVVAAWGDLRDGPIAVYAQRVVPPGQIAPGWPVNGFRIVLARAIRGLIPDGAGGAYLSCATVAYQDSGYYLQRFTGAGAIAPGWPEGGAVVCAAPDDRGGLRMVPDGAGGALLTWTDYRDFYDSEIFVQRMRPDGTRYPGWPADGLRATENTAFDDGSELAPDGMGGAYLCWDRVSAGAGTDNRVVIQHLTGAGLVAPGWPANGREIPGPEASSTPRIAPDGQGGAIAVWERDIGLRALRFVTDGPVPVLVSLIRSEAYPDRVSLAWHAAEGASLRATVERRTEGGAWQRLAEIAADGTGRLGYEDRAVEPGARYAYRLAYVEDGIDRWSAESWVEVPRALALALEGARPNPAVGEFAAAFTLPRAGPARLELLDVSGRMMIAREVGDLGPGRHLVRLGDSGRTPSGVYWLRLRQADRVLVTRIIVLQ